MPSNELVVSSPTSCSPLSLAWPTSIGLFHRTTSLANVMEGRAGTGAAFDGPPPPRRHGRPLSVVLGLSGLFLLVTSIRVVHVSPGRLTYLVDDAQIHLRLAEQLSHGTYGINAGMASSPSSSILWPLLLTPFARFSWVDWD